jgi:predicted transcriptional regulator YheO
MGEEVELVLHELSHPQDSVVAIAGDVTGRKIGAPLTDLYQRMLLRGEVRDCINYPTSTADGRRLRSSTIFIRDENGIPIGCLCINFDITKWLVAKHLTASYCQTESLGNEIGETFTGDVGTMLDWNVEEAIEQETIPVALMKKKDKLRVVRRLDTLGVFQIRGAVANVAAVLDVSRYTIYNYLNEARGGKTEAQGMYTAGKGM